MSNNADTSINSPLLRALDNTDSELLRALKQRLDSGNATASPAPSTSDPTLSDTTGGPTVQDLVRQLRTAMDNETSDQVTDLPSLPAPPSHEPQSSAVDEPLPGIREVDMDASVLPEGIRDEAWNGFTTQNAIWESAAAAMRSSAAGDATTSAGEESKQDTTNPDAAETPGPTRRNIEDCINELMAVKMPLVDTVPRLDVRDGDTWVYILPPAREPQQSDAEYERIFRRYSEPFRVRRSAILDKTQSESIRNTLTSPTAQFRLIRRLGVKKHEMSSRGITYVLDLTPPVEGDDAVELTEELSCPSSVVEWIRTSQQWKVSSQMVGGYDELTEPPIENMEERPLCPDYSPLRHRQSIERVLALLHDRDITLDSAPKYYTTVMVATKHLKIPAYHLPMLKDLVTRWVRAVPNNMIMEEHPELVLKLADELQNEHLCQDAFAILVGEAALEVSSRQNPELSRTPFHTVHGRKCGSVHEVWQSRIEYARDVLADRMTKEVFNDIIHENMDWVERLPVILAFKRTLPSSMTADYQSWLLHVKKYIRGAIYNVIVRFYDVVDSPLDHFRVTPTIHKHRFRDYFNKLDYKERILTRTFWKIIRDVMLAPSHHVSNMNSEPAAHSFSASGLADSYSKVTELINAGIITRVFFQYLTNITDELQMRVKDLRWEMRSQGHSDDSLRGGRMVDSSDAEGPRKKARFSDPAVGDSAPTYEDLAWAQMEKAQAENDAAASKQAQPTRTLKVINPDPEPEQLREGLPQVQSHEGNVLSFRMKNFKGFNKEQETDTAESTGVDAQPQTWAADDEWWVKEDRSVPTAPKPAYNWTSKSLSEQQTTQPVRIVQEVFDTPGSATSNPHLSIPTAHAANAPVPVASSSALSKSYPDSITVEAIFSQAQTFLYRTANTMLGQQVSGCLDLHTIDTLVCLEESETKVLPLWAGGLDDGSGGVFNNDVPMADDGEDFGPGREGLRTGDSELGYVGVGSSIAGSSANTSKLVNDGISIIADRRQVYAASEFESVVHAPPSEASASTWSHVSATHTPAESVIGELPPEVEEAPDVSESGSVIFSVDTTMSDLPDDDEDAEKKAEKKAEQEEYAAMFMDSDEDYFSDGDDADDFDMDEETQDEDDRIEADYDMVEVDQQRPGTAQSEDPKGKQRADTSNTSDTSDTSTARTGRPVSQNHSSDAEKDVLIRYKEREQTSLGFTSEAD